MATQTVHFTIFGEDLTNIARARMLDDNPGHAWRIITSLQGEGVADAGLAVLSGTKKFIGKNSSLELVDDDSDDAKAYRTQLAWLFAGRKKINGRWYRPVARVIDFGIRDLRNDHGVIVRSAGLGQGYTNRQWHYAHLGNEIAPSCATDDVIFETCGERPHWQQEPLTVDAAIKEFRDAGRNLEKRGHSIWYPGNDGIDIEVHQYPAGLNGRQRTADTENYERTPEPNFVGADYDDRTPPRRDVDSTEDEHLLDLEEQLAEEQRLAAQAELRKQILAQAGGDLIELTWLEQKLTEGDVAWGRKPMPGGTVMVPRAPFVRWAFSRNKRLLRKAPAWNPIAPSGLKMMNDDRNHTDWVIGSGLDLVNDRQSYYWGPINEAAMALASKIQDEFDDIVDEPLPKGSLTKLAGVHVLNTAGTATGRVVYGKRNTESPAGSIVIVPNLDPKYLAATVHAAALITQEGGTLAHLVSVGRERGLPIVRVPEALSTFNEGVLLLVNTEARFISELEEPSHANEEETDET